MNIDEQLENINSNINTLFSNENSIVGAIQQITATLQNIKLEIAALERQYRNSPYELADPRINNEKFFYPKIATHEALLHKLINEKKSLARFGDGEFAIMDNIPRQKFQTPVPLLAKKLIETISSNDENLLLAITDNYGDLSPYTEQAKLEIRTYMTAETRASHQKYLQSDKTYYDAYISRPYLMYIDKDNAKSRFDKLKMIWNNRNIIIIEGSETRLGVGNDLFSNANSIKRILGPATNSFTRYDDILSAAISTGKKDDLFLLAMGASATVMAYDLTKAGFQAIDIGHIDLEYEWYLQGATNRTMILNKYNNEYGENVYDESLLPQSYFDEIIAKFE